MDENGSAEKGSEEAEEVEGAKEQGRENRKPPEPMENSARPLIPASRVQGTTCYDSTGNRIGTIHDIVLAKLTGEVAYAIMSFGGFLGIGEKYHPVPWKELHYDTELEGYRVGRSGEDFRSAPSFTHDGLLSGGWVRETEDWYGQA